MVIFWDSLVSVATTECVESAFPFLLGKGACDFGQIDQEM
jgi:hypothetical protein